MRQRVHTGLILLVFVGGLLGLRATAYANTTDTTTYGSGSYGKCDFGACTLTLSSGTITNINVVPSAAGKCTVQSNTVSVLTDNTAGYNLTMTTSTTNRTMTSTAGNIAAASSTAAAPTILAMNTWGYRVDGQGNFGSGPTSGVTSGSVPSVTFAGIPGSDQPAAILASSASMANPAVNTNVWYGICANTAVPSGTYTATITYTAVTN